MSPDPGAPAPPPAAPRSPATTPAATAPAEPSAWTLDDRAFEARVVRAFIREGRLASIPARDRKKLVVYRYLVERVFPDPDEVVNERELNMRLALWHPDVATIRRAFVDRGFVRRDGMSYRRAVPLRSGEG